MRASQRTSKRRSTDAGDAPALGVAFFERAAIFDGARLVRRGRGRNMLPAFLFVLAVGLAAAAALWAFVLVQ